MKLSILGLSLLSLLSCRVGEAPEALVDSTEAEARVACREVGAPASPASLLRRGCLKTWSILIYMAAAEEDLRPYAYRNLHEMEAAFPDPERSAASTVDADVLVELDLGTPPATRLHLRRAEVPYAPRRCLAPSGCSPADIRSPVVLHVDEEGVRPAERLRRFLSWGIEEYPSRHTLVVVWGHGLGFRPVGAPDDAMGGIVFGRGPERVLDVPSLRAVLSDVSLARLGGRPVDIHAFDACLMQSLEVATELAPAARYLIGSEQIEDYLGLPYRTIIPRLNGSAPPPPPSSRCAPGDTACEAAALLPVLAQEAFSPGGLYAEDLAHAREETFTLSAASGAALEDALAPALRELSAAIEEFLREDPLRRIDLQQILGETPGFLGGNRDVGVLLAQLRRAAQREAETPARQRLALAIDGARAALEEAVIATALGTQAADPAYAGMAGISAWVPRDAGDLERRGNFFTASRLYALVPEWRGWLRSSFAEP